MAFDHRFCVAPMMDWTDRHCRVFHRLLTRRAVLYTEMLTQGAVLHGKRDRLLAFDEHEHPVALQLGGSEPAGLAEAARIGAAWGYDEINLNVGCPSDRVQAGRFGACLMAEPALVADCVAAMAASVSVPITVKCRLGIDDQDPRAVLPAFAEAVYAAGARVLIVHARKAWLAGLSPKENREVPPLDYGLVFALKRALPALTIVLNGGVTSLEQAQAHLAAVDGVMMGRAAYQSPALLAAVDRRIFSASDPDPVPADVVRAYGAYADARLAEGVPLRALLSPLVGLFQGVPGAKAWRRQLSETSDAEAGSASGVLERALTSVSFGSPVAPAALRAVA